MRLLPYASGVALILFTAQQRAVAQQVSLGVAGGLRATNEYSSDFGPSAESKRYIVGPMVDVSLPKHLSVEFDALYRRIGFTASSGSYLSGGSITRERANSWEFPLILKYHVPAPIRPFVGVGWALRNVSGTDVSSGSVLTGITTDPPSSTYTYFSNQRSPTSYSDTHGLVLAGGLDFNLGHVRLSPQIRYVHWVSAFENVHGSFSVTGYSSNQNEVFGVLGLSWTVGPRVR